MSTHKYPAEATFLLCEDVRKEQGNKVSIFGYFSGSDVQLEAETFVPGLIESLCIYAVFKGGEGTFASRLELTPPEGEKIAADGEEALIIEGIPHTVTIKIRPFPLPALGTYKVVIWLGEKPYEFTFEVKLSAAKATVPS